MPRAISSQHFVNEASVSNFTVLTAPYAGLYGYISTYDVVSDASEITDLQSVVGGVLQEVQLTRIPIFQFGMYSSDDMEISCGQPFYIDGPVHSNGSLYTELDNVMVFVDGRFGGQPDFLRAKLSPVPRGAPPVRSFICRERFLTPRR